MTQGSSPTFLFGGQYVPVAKAPEVPMADWEADIRQLKELGFTAFRAFVAWDRIEREEGRRDYTMLDTALDLAARYGVKVLLNVGGVFGNLSGIYPPQWLVRDHACQQPIRDPRTPADAPRPSGPRQSICLDDPLYRAKSADFLTETVRRLAGHPALGGWCVWNEPENRPCYCPHTVERFRAWLQRRYVEVTALCEAWSLEFPVLYRSWEEVEPPSGVGFLDGGYQPWMDWQTFLQENHAEAFENLCAIIREHDRAGHPLTTNLTPGELAGGAIAKGLDIWRLGRALDVPGISAYTLWDSNPDPADVAVRYARLRATATAPGRPWWTVETEAGPVYWVHGLVPKYTRTPERVLRYWQMIGHGAKAIFGWMYRSRIGNAQAGEFGMLAWDGGITERARRTAEVARTVNRHAALFADRHPRAEVAILAAQSTDLLYRAETHEASPASFRNYWQRSWAGAYRMLWRERIPADFVDDTHVDAATLRPYRALLVPFHVNLCERVAAGLAEYIAAGGLVIADFPFGMKTDGGVLWQRTPGAGLQPVFGAWANDALPVEPDEDAISLCEATLAPLDFRQELYPLPGAEVLGRWRDGQAALVAHRHGRGRTILAGTLLFAGADPAVQGLLARWLAEVGVRPVAEVCPLGETPVEAVARVEVCPLYPLDDGSERVYVVLNHQPAAVRVAVHLPGCRPPAEPCELLTEAPLAVTADGDGMRVELALEPRGVAAFALPSR